MIVEEPTPTASTLDTENLSVGHQFKRARENLNLTPKEVALRLHLKPKVIHMLESDDLDFNLPPIFIRGYYRSYGKLMNYSEQIVEEMLNSLKLPPITTTQELVAKYPKKSKLATQLVPAVLFVLLALGFYLGSKLLIQNKNELMSAAMHPQALFQKASEPTPAINPFDGQTSNATGVSQAISQEINPFDGMVAGVKIGVKLIHPVRHHHTQPIVNNSDEVPAYLMKESV